MSNPAQPPHGDANSNAYRQNYNQQWSPQTGPSSQQGYPQQGYPNQGYPQQGFPQQQQPGGKKRGGCLKVGLIVLAVLIVLGIVVAAIGGGDDSATVSSNDENSQESGEQPGGGIGFQGKTDKDTGANAGETITQSDIAITTTPLEVRQAEYFPTQICTNITIQNNSGDQKPFNLFDWKLQDPNGAAISGSPPYDNPTGGFTYVDLAPGGQTSGDLCFDGDPAAMPGQYIVLYQGNIFLSDRLAWVNQL